jgi:hypothetical protein
VAATFWRMNQMLKHCKILTLQFSVHSEIRFVSITLLPNPNTTYMRSLYWRLLLILVLTGQTAISQKLRKSDQLTLTNLQNHIHFWPMIN